MGSVAHKEEVKDLYVLRDPNKITLSNIPSMSEHRVSGRFRIDPDV